MKICALFIMLVVLMCCMYSDAPITVTNLTITDSTSQKNSVLEDPFLPIKTPEVETTPQFSDSTSVEFSNNEDVSIKIPKIGIDTKLKVAQVVETDNGLEFIDPGDDPMWVPDWSRDIGQVGVSMIYGHRQWGPYPKVFSDLDKIFPGDLVIIKDPEKTLTFKVRDTVVVNPDQLWPTIEARDTETIQSKESLIALVTCTPWGTAWQRLIVFAVLEESLNE